MQDDLYVIAWETGFSPTPMPTWTDRPGAVNPYEDARNESITRVDIPEVPGAFQLLNVLSEQEADNIVSIAESLGFHEDSPVSLSHDVRHNENMNWVVSEHIDGTLWERSQALISESVGGQHPTGLNARFRFYRYGPGDFFSPHTDGAWPGSRVIDGKLIADAYPGQYSQFTYLIFLSDDYEGGKTQFLVSKFDASQPATHNEDINVVSVHTPKGAVLCFPHGTHPQHCVHAGEKIRSGVKYIVRTEILFA